MNWPVPDFFGCYVGNGFGVRSAHSVGFSFITVLQFIFLSSLLHWEYCCLSFSGVVGSILTRSKHILFPWSTQLGGRRQKLSFSITAVTSVVLNDRFMQHEIWQRNSKIIKYKCGMSLNGIFYNICRTGSCAVVMLALLVSPGTPCLVQKHLIFTQN